MNSVVNGDGGIVEYRVQVSPGMKKQTLTLPGPTDSISVLRGNGYNRCGDLEYTLFGQNSYTDAFMKLTTTVNSGLADTLEFELESYEGFGTYIEYHMSLIAALKDFPTATRAQIPVIFLYRECSPFDFRLRNLSELDSLIEILVGDTHSDVNVQVSQSPCNFGQIYEASLPGDHSLPDFIILSQKGFLIFEAPKTRHIGTYEISVRSVLESQTRIEARGQVTVVVSPKVVAVELPIREPVFYLSNQEAFVNQTYSYEVPAVFNYEGRRMNITLELGSAGQFVSFDSASMTLSSNGNLLRPEFEGVYRIIVKAWLEDELKPETYYDSFYLKVYQIKKEKEVKPDVKVDKEGKPVKLEYKKLKEPKYIKVSTARPAPANPRQPKP